METERKKRILTAAQVAIAVLVVAGVAWLVFKLVGYSQAQQVYQSIQTEYVANAGGVIADENPVDFDGLREQYPSVVGWLQMDDMDLSYPIVQGDDNDFYLHNDPAGQPNIAGSVFLDYRNKSLDTDLHCIVYAHNMLDESMFGKLDDYTNEDFFRRGSGTFRIYTPEGSYRYQIFAVDIVDPSSDVYQVGFTNTQVFSAFVKQLKESSMYDTGVQVAGSDRVVTLSTCSDTNRLVISAKRL